MKKRNIDHVKAVALCAIILVSAIIFPIGVFGMPVREVGASFTDVEGREWILAEVRSAGGTVVMDREKLAADNLAGVYTIRFEEGRVSGMGAPNRYFGPYTTGDNRTLGIGNIASTMMMALREPDGLSEREFFNLLSKAARWDLVQGKLEIYCEDGTVLSFNRN